MKWNMWIELSVTYAGEIAIESLQIFQGCINGELAKVLLKPVGSASVVGQTTWI